MKAIILFLTVSIFTSTIKAQEKNQLDILNKFISAHNLGTEEAIGDFIKNNYSPAIVKKIALDKHIAFYMHIVKEFGPLNEKIYDVVEVKPTKLIVNLIKEGESINNRFIKPTEILMVEIDTDANQPAYLSRGLGLGALACSIRDN